MDRPLFPTFLRRQIPVIIALSLGPGLGYIVLSWRHGIQLPALIWYASLVLLSAFGWYLYRDLELETMSKRRFERWYRQLSVFYYVLILLWTGIFLIYVGNTEQNLHFIAVFTEIGTITVTSALLYPDRRLYRPLIVLASAPLVLYLASIGEWYSHVLTAFALVLAGVLIYAADGANALLLRTHHQASHDALTGLRNRQFFLEHLQQLVNGLREDGTYSCLLLIDLDHFKVVNDSLGHDVGDRLLQEVSRRIQEVLPEGYVLARLGGDEFIAVAGPSPDLEICSETTRALAAKLLETIKQTYVIEGHHLFLSASIGLSPILPGDEVAGLLIKQADIAMYEVKATGRDGVFVFNQEMSHRVERHLEIERLLHFALEREEISLHYQPQVDAEGLVVGAEGLVRWNSKECGPVSPGEFIPIAEYTGYIIELGDHILETILTDYRSWHEAGLAPEQISVNLSIRQLLDQGFVTRVRQLTERLLGEALRGHLIFEITESVVAEDLDRVVELMNELRTLGIRFSMDDFGTGYSSLSYIKRLPLDELKIDRAFIMELDTDAGDQAMLDTMFKMARIFDLKVVAEGVETEAQSAQLRAHDCDIYQGYLFARPMPRPEFEAFCRKHLRRPPRPEGTEAAAK
ncbi:MAG: EAL domain-containing protein [Deltaproteobacteria bacterium]|nr:EAL domain-containing protein [Deltaproteobacteria bacterium]